LEGTQVAVGWNGRFDHSVVILGNTRTEATQFRSPSIYLEAGATAHLESIHVTSVGALSVDSNLVLNCDKEIGARALGALGLWSDSRIDISATHAVSMNVKDNPADASQPFPSVPVFVMDQPNLQEIRCNKTEVVIHGEVVKINS
jgi:hypothetical protein